MSANRPAYHGRYVPCRIGESGLGSGSLPTRRLVWPTYQASRRTIVFEAPGASLNGTNSVPPGDAPPSVTGGRSIARAVGDVLPGHRQRIEPAAAEPGVVHLDRRVAHGGRERAFLPRLVLARPAPEDEPAGRGLHRLRVAAQRHEVLGVPGEHRLDRLVGRIGEAILQRGHRQAGVVGVARLEGAPAGDLDLQRHVRVAQRHRAEGEPRAEVGFAEPRQAERRARRAVARARLAEQLPARHRAFQHAGDVGRRP